MSVFPDNAVEPFKKCMATGKFPWYNNFLLKGLKIHIKEKYTFKRHKPLSGPFRNSPLQMDK